MSANDYSAPLCQRTMKCTTLAAILCIGIVLGSCPIRADIASDIQAQRHAGMCQYARATPLFFHIEGGNLPGQPFFEDVYEEWFHSIGKLQAERNSSEWFYRVLCAMLLMENNIVTDEGWLTWDINHAWQALRPLLGFTKTLNEAMAKGNMDVRTLQPLLKAGSKPVTNALLLNRAFNEIGWIQAASADAQRLFASPIVVSENALAILNSIKQSTGDAGLVQACDRLSSEIISGQSDYINRLKALVQGESATKAAIEMAKYSMSKGVPALLKQLGMSASAGASAGTVAGCVFAAFVAGVETGFWLTGESAAYEHARLCHFAAYMYPGMLEQWRNLQSRLDPNRKDVCADFDATTRAILLLVAFINHESTLMRDAWSVLMWNKDYKEFTLLSQGSYELRYLKWHFGTDFQIPLELQSGSDRAGKWPFDPILVIDRSGSIQGVFGLMQGIENDAGTFVDQLLRRARQVAVINFSSRGDVHVDCRFSSDRARVLQAINNPSVTSGGTALYQAVDEALNTSPAGGKTAVIVFSDGCENSSMISLEEAIRKAQERGVPVLTVGYIGDGGRNEDGLKQLAGSTHGFYERAEALDVDKMLNRFSDYLEYKKAIAPVGGAF